MSDLGVGVLLGKILNRADKTADDEIVFETVDVEGPLLWAVGLLIVGVISYFVGRWKP
jgi:hypothetical protein